VIGSNPNLFPDEGKRGENTGPCREELDRVRLWLLARLRGAGSNGRPNRRSSRGGLRSDIDMPNRDGRSRRLRVANCTRRGELRTRLLLVTVLPLVVLLESV
jgi:hypothetical protein